MSELDTGSTQFLDIFSQAERIIETLVALGIGKPFQSLFLCFIKVLSQQSLKRQLFCGFSIFLLVGIGECQITPGFYWHGIRQVPPTPEALKRTIKAHELWIESNGRAGTRADLSHGCLSNANLAGANLWGADFEGAYLPRTDLTGAVLGPDGQKDQHEVSNVLGAIFLPPPRITSVSVPEKNGRIVKIQTSPGSTNISGANLNSAALAQADLSESDLSKAYLEGADLTGANLRGANLSGANLTGARLDGANLNSANLDRTIFDPASFSSLVGIESAANLNHITFGENPDALIKIRKLFQDEGLTKQEREITYALNREQTKRDPWVERWFRILAFDLTCQYGMSPGRPLRVIMAVWAIFSLLYIFVLHSRWRLFRIRISRFYQRRDKTREFRMWSAPYQMTSKSKRLIVWLRFEWRTVFAMLFFSLVNAFNLGYREFNIGQWLRMLTTREYEVKAVGGVRSLAGVQSLISVYLFALWILTYFGRPFGE
jgi:uncharacterized protein YjbI with pentapeptide repeats